MVNQEILAGYCQQYLRVDKFDDYCPNGLQIVKRLFNGIGEFR
jgi:hypothetical protein